MNKIFVITLDDVIVLALIVLALAVIGFVFAADFIKSLWKKIFGKSK